MTTHENVLEGVLTISAPETTQNSYEETLAVGIAALEIFPPFYVQSILGPAYKWIPPYREYSEFTILNPWKPITTLEYVVDITVPAFSGAPNKWVRTFSPPLINNLFWRPSSYHQQMDPFDSETSFINEKWFFINGISTNETVAEMNSTLLSNMFRRPITLIHNSTCSTVLDLVQCVVGIDFKNDPSIGDPQSITEPAYVATVALLEALLEPTLDKIVLIAHSQGTIITANVLRAISSAFQVRMNADAGVEDDGEIEVDLLIRLALKLLPESLIARIEDAGGYNEFFKLILSRLEVYTFANCAERMTYLAYVHKDGERIGLPYIENIANQHDIVARLGALSPYKDQEDKPDLVKIDGPVYEQKKGDTFMASWGHLLNQCYLFSMDDYLNPNKPDNVNPYPSQIVEDTSEPRLYGYYAGKHQGMYL